MPTPDDDCRQRVQRDPDTEPGPGQETVDEQRERWRHSGRQALDRDLEGEP